MHDLLEAADATVATAESLTGGRLAALLTTAPGASQSYLGGVVSYATSVKTGLLGVPEELVAEHGVISAECAAAMAAGVRRLIGATWALSTTGVAGPAPQEDTPPGVAYVAVDGPGAQEVLSLELAGDREHICQTTCQEAVRLLLRVLDGTSEEESTPLG